MVGGSWRIEAGGLLLLLLSLLSIAEGVELGFRSRISTNERDIAYVNIHIYTNGNMYLCGMSTRKSCLLFKSRCSGCCRCRCSIRCSSRCSSRCPYRCCRYHRCHNPCRHGIVLAGAVSDASCVSQSESMRARNAFSVSVSGGLS